MQKISHRPSWIRTNRHGAACKADAAGNLVGQFGFDEVTDHFLSHRPGPGQQSFWSCQQSFWSFSNSE